VIATLLIGVTTLADLQDEDEQLVRKMPIDDPQRAYP
jgi:hypothetical protein